MFHTDAGGAARMRALFFPPFNVPVSGDQNSDDYHLWSRWKHRFSERADCILQLYFDHPQRRNISLDTDHQVDIFDLDFQTLWSSSTIV